MVPPETISSGLLVPHQRYSHSQIKLSYVLNVGQGALKIPCEVFDLFLCVYLMHTRNQMAR